MEDKERVKEILTGLIGKKLVKTDVEDEVRLEFEDGSTIVIAYGSLDEGVPDNTYLTVNGLRV